MAADAVIDVQPSCSFPAVAAADDGSGIRAKVAGRRCDQSELLSTFLLRLTELELGTRAANAIATRIKNAGFPVLKDLDTFDFFAACRSSPSRRSLELGAWRMDRTQVQLLSCRESGELGRPTSP